MWDVVGRTRRASAAPLSFLKLVDDVILKCEVNIGGENLEWWIVGRNVKDQCVGSGVEFWKVGHIRV